jgi:hypothetical protein
MVGMLQVITYMLAFYLVVKGIEILQIAMASAREHRSGMIILGSFVLAACIVSAIGFVGMQDGMATHVSSGMQGIGG